MRKKNRWFLALACLITAIAITLAFSGTFARYLEMLTGDQAFQVKPMEPLQITQKWMWNADDNTYVITFTAGERAKNCKVYLAVSEGVTNVQSLQVEMTAPVLPEEIPTEETEETEATEETQETVAETLPETVTLQATGSAITEGSAIYNLFGSGTVFQFQNTETQEELVFDLSQHTYTITVRGLDSAAELTSLLRLFVEYVQE